MEHSELRSQEHGMTDGHDEVPAHPPAEPAAAEPPPRERRGGATGLKGLAIGIGVALLLGLLLALLLTTMSPAGVY